MYKRQERAFHRLAPQAELHSRACPLFVPLVEEGRCRPGDPVIETVAEEYLSPLKALGVDTLVLGCTHYPLLTGVIGGVMGEDVALIDAGAESAGAVQALLARAGQLADRAAGQARYYTSDRPENFARLAPLFLGENVGNVEQIDITRY